MPAASLPAAPVHHLRTGLQWFRLADTIGGELAALLATEAVDRALALWPPDFDGAIRETVWTLRSTLTAFPGPGADRALRVLEAQLASLPAAA